MEKCFAFAGVELKLIFPEDSRFEEEGQLASFRVAAVQNPHVFHFSVVDHTDPPPEVPAVDAPPFIIYQQNQSWIRYIGKADDGQLRVESCGYDHRVQLKRNKHACTINPVTVVNALTAEHLVVEAGGVILHCSYVDWNGKGILFTAPSETGKSTQAELWCSLRGADIINGDRAAMRYVQGQALAMGIPFSGSSAYCENRTLPLAAVVCLGQAPNTTIRRIKGFSAFHRVWEGCCVNSWNREDMERASGTVMRILDQIPVFELHCTPDESAVIALEKALQEV